MSKTTRRWAALAVLATILLPARALPAEVNIYSYRQEHLIRPLLDAFTSATGIEVNLVSGKADALLERLKSEGINSPADMLLTADVGRLIRAKAAGVLQAIDSPVLDAAIPLRYRDPEGYWFGLSLRARVIFHAPDRIEADRIRSYESLADPELRDRICVRSSSSVYNQSLLAAMIEAHGSEAAEAWAAGVVANFARKPQGGDRDQIRALAAGECDVALANTYYFARMLTSDVPAEREAAEKVALVWPNQGGRGAHVNVAGAGVTRSSRNRDAAVRLLEFLAGPEAQGLYAGVVYEYPIDSQAERAEVVAAWGDFKADDVDLAALGRHQATAVRIFDRAGWR
jgi:iron(III) transport system substrate-binding protein